MKKILKKVRFSCFHEIKHYGVVTELHSMKKKKIRLYHFIWDTLYRPTSCLKLNALIIVTGKIFKFFFFIVFLQRILCFSYHIEIILDIFMIHCNSSYLLYTTSTIKSYIFWCQLVGLLHLKWTPSKINDDYPKL